MRIYFSKKLFVYITNETFVSFCDLPFSSKLQFALNTLNIFCYMGSNL